MPLNEYSPTPRKDYGLGRYKDVFGTNKVNRKRMKGIRETFLDVDHKAAYPMKDVIDLRNRKKVGTNSCDRLPNLLRNLENESRVIARDELKKLIIDQKIPMQKHS